MPAGSARVMNERILVPNTPRSVGPRQQAVQLGEGLHQAYAVLLVGESLVHLDERNDLFVLPQVGRGPRAGHVPVHGLLEQDRAEDAVAGERGRGDDPGPELVHQVEHLVRRE